MKNPFRSILAFVVSLSVFNTLAIAQQDFSKVEIKATKVAGNVYMLEGSGGNIGCAQEMTGL